MHPIRPLRRLVRWGCVCALAICAGCGPPATPEPRAAEQPEPAPTAFVHVDPRRACLDDVGCNDGLFCNGLETCLHGACLSGTPADCDDGDACTEDACVEAAAGPGCHHTQRSCPPDTQCDPLDGACRCAEGEPCEDGDACTVEDVCSNGECRGGRAADCDDQDPCTQDVCGTLTGCLHVDIPGCTPPTEFPDGDGLPGDGVPPGDGGTGDGSGGSGGDNGGGGGTGGGGDLPCSDDADCNDDNPCTQDACDSAGGCVHTPGAGMTCSLPGPCWLDAACVAGQCVGSPVEEGTPCNDGDPCTADDACSAGACAGTPLVNCACDQNGDCDDGDPCTTEVCFEGQCVTADTQDCDDGNPCTDDTCVGPACSHTPNSAPCDDGNDCTFNDRCADGQCWGTVSPECNLPDHVLGVRADAPGARTGEDWFNAFHEVAAAIEAAADSGGTVTEIWVAAGTYRPDYDPENDSYTASRVATFELVGNLALYGGFSGIENQRTRRRPLQHATILSGEIGVAGDADDNSHHVVRAGAVPASAVLDGFMITAGNAQGAALPSGGGLLVEGGGPTVANCTFLDNRADNAGGAYLLESAAVLMNCRFLGNTGTAASANGGALNVQGGAVTIANCAFSGNDAALGAGAVLAGSPTLNQCTFSGNHATSQGGGVYILSTASPLLANCILWGNSDADGAGESAQIRDAEAAAALVHCCVEGLSALGGEGLIDAVPGFVDARGPDGAAGTLDDDLRLAAGSPCIDAGDDGSVVLDAADLDADGDLTEILPLDLLLAPRVIDCGAGAVDVGAYETSCSPD